MANRGQDKVREVSELALFKSYLRSKGLRLTHEREVILKEITNLSPHFEAEDLLVRLREQRRPISRATIYRTLPLMVRCGILGEVKNIGQNLHYEPLFGGEHHDHLICLSCGDVMEFNDPPLEDIQNKVCESQGFTPRTHTMEITGRCKECSDVC